MNAHLIVTRRAVRPGHRRSEGWVEAVCSAGDYVSKPSTSVGKASKYGQMHADAKNKETK